MKIDLTNRFTVVLVAPVVELLGDNLVPEEGARAQQLSEEGDDDQDDAVAYAVAHTVEERLPRLMAQREGLEASHKDTVGNDEPHEDRELFAHLVHIGFEHLIYDDNQCRYHYQLYNDADAVGDGIAQQRDDDVGESDDGSHRYGHDECRFEFCRYGQGRTDTQYLHDHRVVLGERP